MKHDIEANWLKAVNFKPMPGEIVVYDEDDTHSFKRIKIGALDENSEAINVNDLPFVTPIGSYQVTKTTEWDYNNLSGVKFYSPVLDVTGWKVSDVVLPKEIALTSQWKLVDTEPWAYDTTGVNQILFDTPDIFTAEIKFGSLGFFPTFMIAYNAGEIPVSYMGYNFTIDIPETGLYQLQYGTDSLRHYLLAGSINYGVKDEYTPFVQGDWNQNDPKAPDYIKNKPFGNNIREGLFEHTYALGYDEIEDYYAEGLGVGQYDIIENEEYQVVVNGTEYLCTCFKTEDDLYALGNPGFFDEDLMNDIPFILVFGQINDVYGHMFYPAEEPETLAYYHISVRGLTGKIDKVPGEFLYQPDWEQNNETAPDYIKNKPGQVDWNAYGQSNGILNQPFGIVQKNTILAEISDVVVTHDQYWDSNMGPGKPISYVEFTPPSIPLQNLTNFQDYYFEIDTHSLMGKFNITLNQQLQGSAYKTDVDLKTGRIECKDSHIPTFTRMTITNLSEYVYPIENKYLPFNIVDEDGDTTQAVSVISYDGAQAIERRLGSRINGALDQTSINTQNITKINSQLENTVQYNKTQNLTTGQQSTARKNINAQEQISITSSLKYGDNVYLKNGTGLILKGKTVYKNMCSVNTTGEFTQMAVYDIEPLEPGIYTFSCYVETNNPSNVGVIHFLNSRGSEISGNTSRTLSANNGKRNIYTINFDETITQLRVYSGQTFNEATGYTATFYDIQMEANHMATDYEPYQTSQTGIGAKIIFNSSELFANAILMDGDSLDFVNKTITRADGSSSSITTTGPSLSNFVKADYKVRTNGEALLTYTHLPLVSYNPQKLTDPQRLTVRKTLQITGKPGGNESSCFGYSTVASGQYSFAEGNSTKATNVAAHAEGYSAEASGWSAHAEGHKTTALGEKSHAEGYLTNAENLAAHAEGQQTVASGQWSHAEGLASKATNNSAHAEGNSCQATNSAAHAEGVNSVASGYASHAEGSETLASSYYGHAEGFKTQATGNYAHSEGRYTIANGDTQHVQGKYNIKLGSAYAHIVGNGKSEEERSNAHTLDWDGNAWYAGQVKAKGFVVENTDGTTITAAAVPAPKTDNTDENKMLMVVNGKPTWVAITNGNEVAF